MPIDNPTVMCTKHAQRFTKTAEELDHDGSQTLVKQYWEAACGCKVEITLVIPDTVDRPHSGGRQLTNSGAGPF